MIIRQNAPDCMAIGTEKETSRSGTGEYAGVIWTCYSPDFSYLSPSLSIEIYRALSLKITPCGIGSGPWLDISEFTRKTGPLHWQYERLPQDLSDEELVALGEWMLVQHPAEHAWRYWSAMDERT